LAWAIPGGEVHLERKETPPTFPPNSLIRIAIFKKLIPTNTFSSVEELRETVYEAIANLEESIKRLDSYNAFWDIVYEGRKKGLPSPKKETDIHPTIQLLLDEWAFLRSIEIVSENRTGAGDLDFAFIGSVENQGPVSICMEVKRAHSDDLSHGLEVQLPGYMQRKRAQYGVFVVLWFKGEWFDKPNLPDIRYIANTWLTDVGQIVNADVHDLEFALKGKVIADPKLQDIRVFIIDVSKPIPASRA
jgi:hypothetical protein